MEEDDLNIKVVLDSADAAASIKDIKKQIKELDNAALNVGEGGKGFTKLTQKAAQLRDKLDDLKDTTRNLTGSGIEKLTGSMNLLREGMLNADPGKLATGFKVMSTAMKAIPIFALIEGLKLLWENFDKVLGFINGSTERLAKAEEQYKNTTKATNLQSDALSREIAMLEANGASEDMIIAKKKEKMLVDIEAAKASIKLNEVKLQEIKANNSIYESTLGVVNILSKLAGNYQVAAVSDIAYLKSKKERSEEFVKAQDAAKKSILDLENSFNVEKAKIVKKADAAEIDKQKEHNKHLDDIQKLWIQSNLDATEKAYFDNIQRLKDQEAAQIKELQNVADEPDSHIEYKIDVEPLNEATKADINKKVQEIGGYINRAVQAAGSIATQINEMQAEKNQARYDAELTALETSENNKEAELKRQLDKQLITQDEYDSKLAKMQYEAAEDMYRIKKAAWEKSKKAKLNQIIIDTFMGTSAAFMSAMDLPYPANLIAGGIAAGIANAFGVAQYESLKKTQFDGAPPTMGSTSSSSSGSSPSSSNQSTATQPSFDVFATGNGASNNQSGSSSANQPHQVVRAYVVGQEITDEQTAANYVNSMGHL